MKKISHEEAYRLYCDRHTGVNSYDPIRYFDDPVIAYQEQLNEELEQTTKSALVALLRSPVFNILDYQQAERISARLVACSEDEDEDEASLINVTPAPDLRVDIYYREYEIKADGAGWYVEHGWWDETTLTQQLEDAFDWIDSIREIKDAPKQSYYRLEGIDCDHTRAVSYHKFDNQGEFDEWRERERHNAEGPHWLEEVTAEEYQAAINEAREGLA